MSELRKKDDIVDLKTSKMLDGYKESKLTKEKALEIVDANSKSYHNKNKTHLKVPDKTHEIIREVFAITGNRIKKLEPISNEERIAIKGTVDILNSSAADKVEMYVYRSIRKSCQTDYFFSKDLVKKRKPNLQLMGRAYVNSLHRSFNEGRTKIVYTAGDKLRTLGYTEDKIKNIPGNVYSEIDRAESALASMPIRYENRKRGKGHIRILGTLTSLVKTGEGKGALYEITINENFTKGMDFLNKNIEGHYCEISISDMNDLNMNLYEKNIRIRAKNIVNCPVFQLYGSTILQWASMSESDSKHKDRREKIYLIFVKVMMDLGFQFLKKESNGSAKDFRKWKFYYRPPKTKSNTQGTRKAFCIPGIGEIDFIKRYTDWQMQDVHYTPNNKRRLTEEQISERIKNTVNKYGLDVCLKIFRDVNNRDFPSPLAFWNEIKALKKTK